MNNQTPRSDDLFRIEALESRKVDWLGEVVLIRPISFKFMTLCAAIVGAVVVAFLWFGTYTKRVTVNGQLIPTAGLTKLYAAQPGIILEKNIQEGQHVKKGQILYLLSSEKESSTLGATQSAISEYIRNRHSSLEDEIRKTREVQTDEKNTLINKIRSLQQQIIQINDQIRIQSSRFEIAKKSVSRYEGLVVDAYVSAERLEEKQADALDQSLKLNGLLREQATTKQELLAQKNELSALPSKHKNQIAQISRYLSNSEQELSENEAKRRIVVSAPQDGTITGAMLEVGQFVDSAHPLVSLIPDDSKKWPRKFGH